MRRRFVVASALLVSHFAFCAAPDIESISLLALQPGVSTKLTLSGSDLSDATQLWTSFPAEVESLGGARFRVTAKTTIGIGALRVLGSNGISNLRPVMIDDLRTVAEISTNKTRAAAQPVTLGSAVDGRSEELSYDWFRVRVNKGQRLSIETVAARLGSKFDSHLRVINNAGRELARNDDAPGLSGDSFISFTAREADDYFIEVRDVNYAGGSAFFYRLRVGDFPLAPVVFPPAAEPGSTHSFQLVGPSGVASRATLTMPANVSAAPLSVQDRAGSAFVKVLASDRREFLEAEPNDVPARATKISLSSGVSGRFEKASDRDVFEFQARKGERIEFRAATRSLGSPCDAVMRVENIESKSVARSNPSAADEGVLTAAFASNGWYRLVVEEATGAFGAHMVYRVTTRPAAGFSLTLDTDRVNVAPGKSFELKVTAVRGDYKGAISLAFEGVLEDFTVTNSIIADGKSNVTVKVTAPETLVPATWRKFSVVGIASRQKESPRVRASTLPALRRTWPQLLHPPPEFDGTVVLGVTKGK